MALGKRKRIISKLNRTRKKVNNKDNRDYYHDDEMSIRAEDVSRNTVNVTLDMVKQWTTDIKKDHSLSSLKELITALHCGIVSIISSPDSHMTSDQYTVEGEVFNKIVSSCLLNVYQTLQRHLYSSVPETSQQQEPTAINKHSLPSTHVMWGRVRLVVKCYLTDILQLLSGVTDIGMVCAILRHIEQLVNYFYCFPKISRLLTKQLMKIWSRGVEYEPAALIAFLILRRVFDSLREHKKEELLKDIYLCYIRNSKYTSTSTLSHIHLMRASLVDILSLSQDHAYQLIFTCTRQLGVQLRSAYGDHSVSVVTWPLIHSLELFTSTLSSVISDTLAPLLYPVIHVALGVVQYLHSPMYIPTRLHIVRMLIPVAMETGTYIPLVSILVEILEGQCVVLGSKDGTAGRPPNLQCILKLKKSQLKSSGTQSVVLNTTIDLLLQVLVGYSHLISFPELCFPTVLRIKKVIKETKISWLKHHLKQIIDKVDEVNKNLMEDRSQVTFSPKDTELIVSWESQQKLKENPLNTFLKTWQALQT